MPGSPMIKEMTDLYEAFVAGCTSGADLEGIALAWQEMGERIRTKTATGTMSTVELDLAYRLATNVWALTNQTLRLEEDHDAQLEKLSAKLSTIAAQDYPDEICFMNKSRSRKRGASPAVGVKKVPSNNGLPHREDDAMISDVYQPVGVKPTDHIREWFLQHLASPYPSAVEKDSLSELSGIPRSKIDSDMTNWRRRAGWTDIKDNWANGSRDAMRLLIERVESGQEKRKGVREAVEKMKAYLERREEERVGDWVKELTALAKPAAKKARLAEDEHYVEDDYTKSETLRELTPPLTQHAPPGSLSTMSSISSLATATSAMRTDISPAVSLRSASSSSMSSTSSVLSKDFEFKPYQYSGTMSSGYGTLNGSTKRELPAEMATSAEREQRFKHSAQVHSPQGDLPQWVTDPNYGGRPAPTPYFAQGYPPQQMGFHVGHAGPSSYPIYPQPQQVMYSYAPPTQYPHLGQGHPQQSPQGQPAAQGQGGNGEMWSSNAPMPLLPHMQVHQANTWQMPQQWEFRSPVGQWSQ